MLMMNVEPIANIMGFRLYETTAITKEVQRRTHKKRRINKKWLKRYGYKTVLDHDNVVLVGDCVYATPQTIRRLISALKGGE